MEKTPEQKQWQVRLGKIEKGIGYAGLGICLILVILSPFPALWVNPGSTDVAWRLVRLVFTAGLGLLVIGDGQDRIKRNS